MFRVLIFREGPFLSRLLIDLFAAMETPVSSIIDISGFKSGPVLTLMALLKLLQIYRLPAEKKIHCRHGICNISSFIFNAFCLTTQVLPFIDESMFLHGSLLGVAARES